MRNALLLLVSGTCFAVGCGSGTPTDTISKEVSVVSIENLVGAYVPNRVDRTFTNRRVQVAIEPKTYRIVPGRIEAFRTNDWSPFTVYFEAEYMPPTNEFRLVVTGTCRGIVKDGQFRQPGCDYFIRVESCSVTVLPIVAGAPNPDAP